MTFCLDTGPPNAAYRIILAHGAGAGITFSFMEQVSDLLTERAFAVTRFEFAYMAARRTGGPRRPPPKAEILAQEYATFLDHVSSQKPRGQKLLIGGKSLGGRVASLMAAEAHREGRIAGLVCLGYPLHPPGQPDRRRAEHLMTFACPALIVQGERDPFGNKVEFEALALPQTAQLHWIGDGDHDFGPRGASGFTRKGNLAAAADAIATFAAGLDARVDGEQHHT
jgi:uncharacterized protein